ncbi:MAG: CDF family Co(II)/Ni(II) efflux transporter DmeF [Betaproteobacteria bacterium]
MVDRSAMPQAANERPPWEHGHDFHIDAAAAERGTRAVVWITLATMVVEILAGWWFNSMALLADGWHMSSHAVAIGVSALAYAAARRLAQDARFAFGTWKIEVLGGFASAILLLGVALVMLAGSAERLLAPQSIQYREAMLVTVLGLLVNMVCALILQRAHGHDHNHDHNHDHDAHGHHHHGDGAEGDLNLRSAYTHVLADAATSVLAIVALAGGWWLGWSWLDPAMGIVGSVLVGNWAMGLVRDSAGVLLDSEMDHPVVQATRKALDFTDAPGATKLTDLHVWRVGRKAWACTVTLVTGDAALTAARVRERLSQVPQLAHSTIEIHPIADAASPAQR